MRRSMLCYHLSVIQISFFSPNLMHLFTFHLHSKLVDWFKFLFLYFFICLVAIVCTNSLKLLAMIVVVCVHDTHNDREWSDNVMLLAMLVWERQQMQHGMQRLFFNNYPDLAQAIKTVLQWLISFVVFWGNITSLTVLQVAYLHESHLSFEMSHLSLSELSVLGWD